MRGAPGAVDASDFHSAIRGKRHRFWDDADGMSHKWTSTIYKTQPAVEYQARVRSYVTGMLAQRGVRLPVVRHAGSDIVITIVSLNCRHDNDAPAALIQDALKGVVFVDDNLVTGTLSWRGTDPGEPRVMIKVRITEKTEQPWNSRAS
jgi:hypothetical protein